MGLRHTNDRLISARRQYFMNNNNKKKRTCKIVNLAVSADHTIKLKECEKKVKYFDLPRESKKLWIMKVTIIPIVIGAVGRVTKRALKGLENFEVGGRMETIQTTALLRTARVLRRVLESCCYSNIIEKPSAKTDVESSQRVNDNNFQLYFRFFYNPSMCMYLFLYVFMFLATTLGWYFSVLLKVLSLGGDLLHEVDFISFKQRLPAIFYVFISPFLDHTVIIGPVVV